MKKNLLIVLMLSFVTLVLAGCVTKDADDAIVDDAVVTEDVTVDDAVVAEDVAVELEVTEDEVTE